MKRVALHTGMHVRERTASDGVQMFQKVSVVVLFGNGRSCFHCQNQGCHKSVPPLEERIEQERSQIHRPNRSIHHQKDIHDGSAQKVTEHHNNQKMCQCHNQMVCQRHLGGLQRARRPPLRVGPSPREHLP